MLNVTFNLQLKFQSSVVLRLFSVMCRYQNDSVFYKSLMCYPKNT